MKLLYCPNCKDITRLWVGARSHCKCGKSSGYYKADGLNARYEGEAIPIGIDNSSFAEALRNQPMVAKFGRRFTAFVIPKYADTIDYENTV